MTTLSVPIPAELEDFIDNYIKSGKGANKAHVVRYALQRLSEEEAVQAVLDAQQEIRAGKGVTLNLRSLI